jgi:hypothetical protein
MGDNRKMYSKNFDNVRTYRPKNKTEKEVEIKCSTRSQQIKSMNTNA